MPNNVFQQSVDDPNGVEAKLLGPSYPYYKNIKTPSELGMSDKGSLQQMGKDIDGLIQYVQVLVSGNSRASKTGKPLGNRFFLQTGAQCLATDQCKDKNDDSTCPEVDRYVYIDNVPSGNVPLLSSGMGVNFSDFRGLVPGTISDLNALNPMGIMRAFMTGSTPPCQQITMETIDNNNAKSTESHYVALTDIASLDPCSFPKGVNPQTGAKCRQAFQTMYSSEPAAVMPTDPLGQIYMASLTALGVYVFFRIMQKS